MERRSDFRDWVIGTILLTNFVLLYSGCGQLDKPFARGDFETFEKIDAHMHVNTDNPAWLEQARRDNFRIFTINTDVPYFPTIAEQRDFAIKQMKASPGRISFAAAFSMDGWDSPDWQEETLADLKDSFEKGAIAVKVWKNIGMSARDKNGKFIMIDDPKFDPIFEYLTEKGIPLVGHIGEPKNCWLPLEEMTVKSDQAYFTMHPEFHMYLHPEYPSYERIISSRDNMLRKHANLRFIGCHLASLEWSVDELARRFDEFPNLAADLAERVCHLQVQSQKDRKKVRDFVVAYQDRIIYGSDFGSGLSVTGATDVKELTNRMHERWTSAWRYFSTDETMTAPELDGEFRGLALPRKVVAKVFRLNAERWYPGI